jgi:hypothetical protein
MLTKIPVFLNVYDTKQTDMQTPTFQNNPRNLAAGSKLLQNIGTYMPMHMASHPRLLEPSQ